MDPNAERRDSCKVCGRKLPAHCTKFCSKTCNERLRRMKQRARQAAAGQPNIGMFMSTVREPMWLTAIAERLIQPIETVRERAEVDVAAGKLLGLRRNGALVAVGFPLKPGEKPKHVIEREALPPGERRQARHRREATLRGKYREHKRRTKRNRRAREAADVAD